MKLSIISQAVIILVAGMLGISPAKADLSFVIEPVDSITRLTIPDAEVLVFAPGDSAVVAEGQDVTHRIDGMMERKVKALNLPQINADYNIYIDAPGYEPRFVPLHTRKAMEEWALHEIGEVGLLRTPKRLDEVTVTATKIKMYYKGDTIVYNADAFLLPDGSMLDDLIRKLPGVTINRSGEIFSNGRKIESLQLEGRKLFDGSPKTLLENLGAYTVSKIKVYEQADRQAEILGYSDEERKPLVMDVRLKKEYSVGKWANIDAGYGTDNRYLGRGFILGFSKTFALSAFVNANNLSAESNPGRGDFWTTGNVGSSESSYLSGGLSYQYNGTKGRPRLSGNVQVNSSRATLRSGQERVNFIPSGDTYESRFNTQHSKSLAIATDHSLTLEKGKTWIEVKPRFNYSNHNSDGTDADATFSEAPGRISAAEIEAIYSGSEEQLRKCLINRQLQRSKFDSRNIQGALNSMAIVRLPGTDNLFHNLTFTLGGSYGNVKSNAFNRFSINYGDNPDPAYDEYAYTRGRPTHNANINGSAKYEINLSGRHTMSLSYSYGRDMARNVSNRYLLSDLQEASIESLKFGQLPAEELLPGTIDPNNSTDADYRSNEHTIAVNTRLVWGDRNLDNEAARGMILLFINPSLRILDRHYDFHKVNYDTLAVRNFVLPQLNARLNYAADMRGNKYNCFASLGWNSNPELCAMDNLINAVSDADPLNVFRGNPDLHTAYNHRASLLLEFSKTKGCWQNHKLDVSYQFTTDAIVRGTTYDPTTGVRTCSMYNVSGNREVNAAYSGYGCVRKWNEGEFHSLDYGAGLSAYANRSAGMIGSDGLLPVKSYVYTKGVAPHVRLSCDFGADHQIKLSFNGNFTRYSGQRLAAFNSANLAYRLDATFRLPSNFVLSSNLTLYCRRGYSDAALNTDEWIWNASASWHWKKAHLTFALDGYDLLHQIKAVSQYVNALGRTESWSNTLPRYAMLRIRYHIDLSPK